jgi:hypothetical protein
MSYYADHSWEEDRWKNKKKKMKWKPKDRDKYWYVSLSYTNVWVTHSIIFWDEEISQGRYKIGNCFRTRKQAQQMAKKIKVLLKGGNK